MLSYFDIVEARVEDIDLIKLNVPLDIAIRNFEAPKGKSYFDRL
jgi:hypothetical protein